MRRLNSKIRLINHGGYGRHSAAAGIAMISLCCSGLTVTLPRGSLARQLALLGEPVAAAIESMNGARFVHDQVAVNRCSRS